MMKPELQEIAARTMVARLVREGIISDGLTKAAEGRDTIASAFLSAVEEKYPEILEKIAKKLTWEERKRIPKEKFAIPEKAPYPGSYPMNDIQHARNAWQRVNAFGSPQEKKRVLQKIKELYPGLYERIMERLRKKKAKK